MMIKEYQVTFLKETFLTFEVYAESEDQAEVIASCLEEDQAISKHTVWGNGEAICIEEKHQEVLWDD